MVSRKSLVAGGIVAAGAAAAIVVADKRGGAVADPTGDYLAEGFTCREMATPSGRLVFYEAGAGTPIVFLHGIGGGASSWTWLFVAPAFARSHRVIVPDWVGWGSSEHPERFVLFDDYVAALEALLHEIGTPATVVAQSLACGFAMALAERRPELFTQFIFHTPSGGKDFGEDAFGPLARTTITPFAKMPGVGFALYRLLFHRRAFIGGWLRREGFFNGPAATRRIVDAFLFYARRPNAAWSALPFASGALRYDLVPYLKRLKVPASMFWGAQESQVGLNIGRRLAALRPDMAFDLIASSKACPELEQPEAVIATLRAALSG